MFTDEEIVCHREGEEYQNTINKIKMYVDQMDDRPTIKRAPKMGVGIHRPLMRYPGYIERRHPLFAPPKPSQIPLFREQPHMNYDQRNKESVCKDMLHANYKEHDPSHRTKCDGRSLDGGKMHVNNKQHNKVLKSNKAYGNYVKHENISIHGDPIKLTYASHIEYIDAAQPKKRDCCNKACPYMSKTNKFQNSPSYE
uniref:Uncharacterized protein n=1 Tax=Clastoptera arizonana TaxID=38151 RepID=A0A1B6D1C0_9HEMI